LQDTGAVWRTGTLKQAAVVAACGHGDRLAHGPTRSTASHATCGTAS